MSLKKMKKEYKRGRKDFDPVSINVSVQDAWRDDSPEPEKKNKWYIHHLAEPTTISFLDTNPFTPYVHVDVETYEPSPHLDDTYQTLVDRLRGIERPRRVIQTANPTEANAWIHSAWSIDNEE